MTAKPPYRTPAPGPPVPEPRRPVRTAEWNVAMPAESPEDRAARERSELAASRKGAYAAQSARVLSEVAEARRSFDRRMRGIGAVFTVLGLAHVLEKASSLAAGEEIYTFRFGGVPLVLGPLLLVVGAAGASDRGSVPLWYSVAVGAAILAGMVFRDTLQVDLPLALAQLFF